MFYQYITTRKITHIIAALFFFVGWVPAHAQDTGLADRLKQHVSILASDSMQGRGLGTEGKYRAKAYIADQFREIGMRTLPGMDDYLQPFDIRTGLAWVKAYNIAGFLEGSDPELKNEYILIGAHYDHLGFVRGDDGNTIYPGADDNASGVAGIIEIARHFASNPELLKRSLIVIAFDAEESGLLGARHFVDNLPVPAESIRLMFSFDMIGMYGANNGLYLPGIGSLVQGEAVASALATNHQIALRRTGSAIARRTDTAPFGQRGIPAIHVYTGSKSPYHKPQDTYELLDYDGMARVVGYSAGLIEAFSGQDMLSPSPTLAKQAAVGDAQKTTAVVFGMMMQTGQGYHRYKEAFFRANALLNLGVGLYAEIPMGQILSLQPAILYDMNGSKIAGGNFRRHSLTLPINLQLGTPRASQGNARVYLNAGPYYRYNLTGRSANVNMDFSDAFTQYEWGYQFGIGIQLFNFQIGYTMRKALTGLTQEDSPGIFDTNSLFSIGVSF